MAKKNPTFESQLAQLEEIVAKLDAEDIPLEEAIDFYEKGVKLSHGLNKRLEEAQQKIEILTQTHSENYEAEPFEDMEEEQP